MTTFAIARDDGRSNSQVIIDLAKDAPFGHLFPYHQLTNALGMDRPKVQKVVLSANRRLCKNFRKVLVNVRGEGYRIAQAREHVALADWRKKRANRQMQSGLLVLRNVEWDQLDPQARAAHEGTLMVMEAMWAQQSSFDRRLSKIEQAISIRRDVLPPPDEKTC